MDNVKIDGKCLAKMLYGGAALLSAHAKELNALNVFPVADGDTGTNMLKTMEGGLAQLSEDVPESVSALSHIFARGVLLAARGNSGVILSQIFAGINECLAAYDKVSAKDLATAYQNGVLRSYGAVQNPTEGTILTVFRESAEYAAAHIDENSSVEDFFRLQIEQAQRSLAATKELLPVLKEADVVDSGAAGYFYIAKGMYEALTGKELPFTFAPATKESDAPDIDRFTRDSKLEFGYCTEFLLRLTTDRVDPDRFELDTVLSALRALGGESVVAYQTGDIVKVHVHTMRPGEVLTRMQDFGEFLTLKIENMALGHSDVPAQKSEKKKKFAVVAVAAGEGMSALFQQMGADCIVAGGQSANPSTEEFVQAFRTLSAEHILVLPNNGNVVMAARQAAELYEDACVHVLKCKSLMQGYAALSVITPGLTDIDRVIESAERAAEAVTDGEITRAVRDVVLGGVQIKCGDYMAISKGQILATAQSAEEAVLKLLENTDADLCELLTLFVGKDVSEQARAALTEQLQETYGDLEITVYEGGQEIYDYFLALE